MAEELMLWEGKDHWKIGLLGWKIAPPTHSGVKFVRLGATPTSSTRWHEPPIKLHASPSILRACACDVFVRTPTNTGGYGWMGTKSYLTIYIPTTLRFVE